MKKVLLGLIIAAVFAVGAYVVTRPSGTPSVPSSQRAIKQIPSFDTRQFSTTDPKSIWVVVNKKHSLRPNTYSPTDLITPSVPLRVPGNSSMQLRAEPATALEEMFAAAKSDGIQLMLSSGYRSYDYQVSLYDGYVSSAGQTQADIQSARPGYSEHQTGLAFDAEPVSRTCELEQCFADTPEGKWLATHAYEYGFILRYTPADIATTGYESEPWHFRYVGKALATEMHKKGVATLEKFFKITGGHSY